MKYIKLFENFDYEDMLEEAKYILISHLGEVEEVDLKNVRVPNVNPHMSDELISKVRVYKLLDSPNVKDLKSCEAHLKEDTEGLFWNINLDWYNGKVAVIGIGKSVEDFCLDWLRERFENANKYTNKGQTFYLDKNNDGGVSILHYYENDVQDKSCYISYNKIWGFLKDTLALEDSQIRSILSKWLLEKFGLNLEPKKW
jgi:hypothetical protein